MTYRSHDGLPAVREEAVIPLHDLLDDHTNGCDCRYCERSRASAVLIRELYWLLDHVNELSSEQWNRRRDAVMTYRSPHA